jgi:hypothetical protein
LEDVFDLVGGEAALQPQAQPAKVGIVLAGQLFDEGVRGHETA